jgi:hypothetical protein
MLKWLVFVSVTHHINVSTPPFMEAPTAQTIEQYLYDLAFDDFYERIEGEFTDWDTIRSEAFRTADNYLTAAYYQWAEDHNALGALIQRFSLLFDGRDVAVKYTCPRSKCTHEEPPTARNRLLTLRV